MTMSEWAVYWQALSAIATAIVGTWGIVKIRSELRRLNEQRENEKKDAERDAKLKRTEFFLEQHRRLFDNEELFEILCLIDDDSAELRKPDMADKKRKFLTFLEEMALLVQSEQIDKSVAYYMFGYYAICVKKVWMREGTIPRDWILPQNIGDCFLNSRLLLKTTLQTIQTAPPRVSLYRQIRNINFQLPDLPELASQIQKGPHDAGLFHLTNFNAATLLQPRRYTRPRHMPV